VPKLPAVLPTETLATVNGVAIGEVGVLKRVMSEQVQRWEISIKRGGKVLKHLVKR